MRTAFPTLVLLTLLLAAPALQAQRGALVTLTTTDGLDLRGVLVSVTDTVAVLDVSGKEWPAYTIPSLDALRALPPQSFTFLHVDGRSYAGTGTLVGAGIGIALGALLSLPDTKGFFSDMPVHMVALPLGFIGGLLGVIIGSGMSVDERNVPLTDDNRIWILRELSVYGGEYPPHIRNAVASAGR